MICCSIFSVAGGFCTLSIWNLLRPGGIHYSLCSPDKWGRSQVWMDIYIGLIVELGWGVECSAV